MKESASWKTPPQFVTPLGKKSQEVSQSQSSLSPWKPAGFPSPPSRGEAGYSNPFWSHLVHSGRIHMLPGKTGSTHHGKNQVVEGRGLEVQVTCLDRQLPTLLWELTAANPRTCKETRSRCYPAAAQPSVNGFGIHGLTLTCTMKKRPLSFHRQRWNCPAAVEELQFIPRFR